ncbi:MAG TPA: glycosyltransferase family 1 protein [Solirubrobacteraceae bacterium]|nr:glycosyltransferase family 1 protein [Solirubrobacteraceae bacterium]
MTELSGHRRPLHVGLNLLYLVPGETGGTETYARELIPELIAAAPDLRLTAFINREAADAGAAPWTDSIASVTFPVRARNRIEWVRGEQQLLPRLAARHGVELVHSLANTGPAWGRFARVVTIHDLMYRIAPDAHLGLRGYGMRVLVPLAARRADRVITDSQSTADDLHRLLGLDAADVDVVPIGLGSRSAVTPLPESELRATLDAGERPLLLCVAAKRPHKNLLRLVGALARLTPAERPLLVIVGYTTPYEAEIRARIDALGLSADVRLRDWVDAATLEGLYAASRGFILPSLYEGFGLPVLEAMSRGLPVACSAGGALAEVAGDAALRFDPESEPAMAEAIQRLINLRGAEAERLRAAGRAQAARFQWETTARLTLDAYGRALERARRLPLIGRRAR